MITINFQKDTVKNHLKQYLERISTFENFEPDMELILYLRKSDDDFIAFEAVNYRVGFFCTLYKVSDIFIYQQVNNLAKYKLTYNSLYSLIS